MKISTRNPLLKYENKWVALDKDAQDVIASGDSLGRLEQKIKDRSVEDPKIVIMKVPPFGKAYAPCN